MRAFGFQPPELQGSLGPEMKVWGFPSGITRITAAVENTDSDRRAL